MVEPENYECEILERRQQMKKIAEWMGKRKILKEYLTLIHPRESPEAVIKQWLSQGSKICVVLFCIAIIFGILVSDSDEEEGILKKGNQLPCTSIEQETTLQVSGSGEDENWTKDITVRIPERNFTEKEMQKWDELTGNYIKKKLPGKNKNLEKVTKDLVFVSQIPNTEISLEWEYDMDYFQEEGKRLVKEISPEGLDTQIVVTAKWRNWKKKYVYEVHLVPIQITETEKSIKKVQKEIRSAIKEQSTKEFISLPQKVGNINVSYREKTEESFPIWVTLPLGMVLVFFLIREQQKKKLAAREEELLLAHPSLVNKIMLLLSAGLTVRKAMERLVAEYEVHRKENGKRQYVYEELCVALQEMKDGISESKAIENFGRRCKLLPYLRFTSVITQNLKKGSEGIIDILEQESLEAFAQRKERILRLGETAGTKLLFPMILMLGVVMGIIMVPAFMTM